MRYVALLLLIFVWSESISQTCVVGRIFQDSIYFGADSRTTRFVFSGNKVNTFFESICKIHIVKNVAFSNIHSLADHSYAIAKDVCNNVKGIKNILSSFAKEFNRKTMPLLQRMKSDNPLYYNSLMSDTLLCQTVFFGFEDSLPYLVAVIFVAKELANGEINIKANSYGTIIYIGGEVNEIESIYDKDNTWENGSQFAIETLIGIEISAHPNQVSYPIDIIKMTQDGHSWIRRKKICSD